MSTEEELVEEYDNETQYLAEYAVRYNYLYPIRHDLVISIWTLLIISLLYIIAIMFFIINVHLEYALAHNYLRPDLKPGIFTSDRYKAQWVIFGLNNLRIYVPFMSLWIFVNVLGSWKRDWVIFFLRILIAFDIFVIVYLLLIWYFACNTFVFPQSMCNSPDYCKAFYLDYPNRCVPEAVPPIDPCLLNSRRPFLVWLVMAPIFLLFDVLVVLLVNKVEKYVQRGLYWGLFYSDSMYY